MTNIRALNALHIQYISNNLLFVIYPYTFLHVLIPIFAVILQMVLFSSPSKFIKHSVDCCGSLGPVMWNAYSLGGHRLPEALDTLLTTTLLLSINS